MTVDNIVRYVFISAKLHEIDREFNTQKSQRTSLIKIVTPFI